MVSVRKRYADTSFGQVHVRIAAAAGAESGSPLVCLHPAPSSGLYFETAFPYLNAGRRVIAPDYPGYGGSDSLLEPPSIADYGQAIRECLADLGVEDAVDVLGFHTGCLVGAEIAIQQPSTVRRLLLCDVPFFDADARASLYDKMARPTPVGTNLESIKSAWTFNVGNRVGDVPLERTIELLAEQLRSPQRDHFGFAAAFSYAAEERLPQLAVDTVILATQSALHEPSLAAAQVIPDVTLIDVTEISTAVFESGAEAIGTRVDSALQ